MVCTGRTDEAHGGVLPWTVHFCGIRVTDFSGCSDFTWEGRAYGVAMVGLFLIAGRTFLTGRSTRIFIICGVSTICEQLPPDLQLATVLTP